MPERRRRQTLLVRLVDHPMLGALVHAPGPLLDHVPAIDDHDVLDRRHRRPCLLALVPHLEPLLVRLLQQDGDAPEIGVGAHPELAGQSRAGGRVADHFHLDDGPLGEALEEGGRVPEALEEDLPDQPPELVGAFVVLGHGVAELGPGEVRPVVGAVEAGGLDDGVFAPDVEGLLRGGRV